MGRVGKELSTSRVVAGQTLLVGAANISLTPWQTNLTFVRASPWPPTLPSTLYLPISFSLLAGLPFSLVEIRVVFQSFQPLSLSLSRARVPFYRGKEEKRYTEKRNEKNTFLSIVINSFAFLPLFDARFFARLFIQLFKSAVLTVRYLPI